MVFAHVIYKKTGLERKTTVKAYNLLKNQYTLLGYVDENDQPVEGPEQQQAKVKTQKKSAVPVVNEPRKQMSPEEIEAKKDELKAMNEAAMEKARKEQEESKKEADKLAPQPIDTVAQVVKEVKKRGPKPKTHA